MSIKEQLQELEEKIEKGMEKAYERMVKHKKYKNTPIVRSKDGKVVKVYPEK